jgi:two-component system, OmpR family, response regulator
MSMTKVLCVDDNADLVEALSEILQAMKYDSRAVTSGEECLSMLRTGKFRPDIVLLDIMMAPMDGWSVLESIRRDEELGDMPVIMLTGKYPTPEEIGKYGMQFDGYLMKPFAFDVLRNELESVMRSAAEMEHGLQKARKRGVPESDLAECRRLTSGVRVMMKMENDFADDDTIKMTCCNFGQQCRSRVCSIMGRDDSEMFGRAGK